MIKSLLAPETIYKQPTILRALQDEAGSDLNAESLLNDRITELLPPFRLFAGVNSHNSWARHFIPS